MEPQKHPFTDWLAEQCAECIRRREALTADLRPDEARFERIRENVYDIFRTVYISAGKVRSTAPEIHLFFLQKLEEIPSNWAKALDLARHNGDQCRAVIEQLKLDTAAHIRSEYLSRQEVSK